MDRLIWIFAANLYLVLGTSSITVFYHQVAEVATKCKDLSQLQFQLQLEKRQAVTLQKQMRTATEDVQSYKRMLKEKERWVTKLPRRDNLPFSKLSSNGVP